MKKQNSKPKYTPIATCIQKISKSKNKTLTAQLAASEPKIAQIINSLQNYLNNQLKDDGKKLIKLIEDLLVHGSKMPAQSIKTLITIYGKYPHLFYQLKKEQKKGLLIFRLISFIINFHQYLQSWMEENIRQMNSQLLKWLSQKQQPLTQLQFNQIRNINMNLWLQLIQSKDLTIIQLEQFLMFKIPFSMTIYHYHQQQAYLCQQLICQILQQIIKVADKGFKLNDDISRQILSFYQNCIQFLSKIPKYHTKMKLPLLDFSILAINSKNIGLFASITKYTLSKFKLLTKDKGISMNQEQFGQKTMKRGSQKPIKKQRGVSQSYGQRERQNSFNQDSIERINITLIASNLLNFKSKISDNFFKKQQILAILLHYKQIFIKIIDELQKLQKSLIDPQIVLSIYDISVFCSQINQKTILSSIFNNILANKDMSNAIFNQNNPQINAIKESKQQTSKDQIVQNLIKYCESLIFTITYRIEKTLCNYNLQIFMDQFIQKPTIFRSQYFIEGIFKNYHHQLTKNFMIKLTLKWLMTDLKAFDYNFYLINFFKKCIKEDKMLVLGQFLKEISVEELLKINKIVFALSFEDEKKKYMIPEYPSKDNQLQSLTSVGFSDKFILINQILPVFSEQLLWRQLIDVINPSANYIIVKSFYNVINYEFKIRSENFSIITKIIDAFCKNIVEQNIEEMFASFHLFRCIFLNSKQYIEQDTISFVNNCNQKVFHTIINKNSEISNLFQLIYERRRSAMNHVVLSSQMIAENMKYFQRLKKMNIHFMKNMIRWIESLDHIMQLIPKNISCQNLLSIVQNLNKDGQRYQYRTLRYLSHYCSQKYFNNLINYKIKPKIDNNEAIIASYIMVLVQIMNCYMNKNQNIHKQSYCINQVQILNYFAFILNQKIGVVNQRQTLKTKILILTNIFELTKYFSLHQNDHLAIIFMEHYQNKFKTIFLQIAAQNPQLVSKYQRDFIIYMRIITIKHIIRTVHSRYEIMDLSSLFALVYELCIDKNLQIRFLLLNILTSRFKQEQYASFLKHKYHIVTFLSIMAIHDPCLYIKITANHIVQRYKDSQQNVFLGLTIFLYSIKHLLINICVNLLRQEYNFSVDYVIKALWKLWISKKDQQYLCYAFILRVIETQNLTFIINPISYRSYIQYYSFSKEKSDFILETQLKEYMKKEWDFAFQFLEGDCTDNKVKLINNIMIAMPLRIFKRLKEIIDENSKNRTIKFKKDIRINWKAFQCDEIFKFHQSKLQMQNIFLM